jgi:uroporphyrinogen-III synthase
VDRNRGRALRKLDLDAELEALEPTTEGLIGTLKTIEIARRRVALQLYAADQDMTLVGYLRRRSYQPDRVAPYVYASAAEDERVVKLIEQLTQGKVGRDRLHEQGADPAPAQARARRAISSAKLMKGLAATRVAAIGPVVRASSKPRECAWTRCPTTTFR